VRRLFARVSVSGIVRTGGAVARSGLALLGVLEAGDWRAARAALDRARWTLLVSSVAAIVMPSVVFLAPIAAAAGGVVAASGGWLVPGEAMRGEIALKQSDDIHA
jgi:hypothetical protein